MDGRAVMCEQDEKHWTQHASLRSASCEGGGGVFSHSNLLWPVCDEVHDPCKQGGVVVAEWLRRWTRNPLGSPRAGSNPANNVGLF